MNTRILTAVNKVTKYRYVVATDGYSLSQESYSKFPERFRASIKDPKFEIYGLNQVIEHLKEEQERRPEKEYWIERITIITERLK